ncbi:MAG TPA: NAD(P)-dependent oxidoreductase, partial [Elusimicrobiota bacterium]|nr:NAD(P)-dependent oxidoreductase [Elusimicrobiota bacterium]
TRFLACRSLITALVRALKGKKIFAAGLDVFEKEPQLAPGLAELPNVLLAPHAGSATVETRAEMSVLAARNVLAVLEGRPALTPVGI